MSTFRSYSSSPTQTAAPSLAVPCFSASFWGRRFGGSEDAVCGRVGESAAFTGWQSQPFLFTCLQSCHQSRRTQETHDVDPCSIAHVEEGKTRKTHDVHPSFGKTHDAHPCSIAQAAEGVEGWWTCPAAAPGMARAPPAGVGRAMAVSDWSPATRGPWLSGDWLGMPHFGYQPSLLQVPSALLEAGS